MEGLIGDLELQAFIGFDELPRDERGGAIQAVCMTTETELVFPGGGVNDCAGGINAFDPRDRMGSPAHRLGYCLVPWIRFGGVRIVAI